MFLNVSMALVCMMIAAKPARSRQGSLFLAANIIPAPMHPAIYAVGRRRAALRSGLIARLVTMQEIIKIGKICRNFSLSRCFKKVFARPTP